MLHPYSQIEILHSIQIEKRNELLKLRQSQIKRPSWITMRVAKMLYATGHALVRAGDGLQQQVEPRFNG